MPSPLVPLSDDRLARHGVRVWLKRDDLIDPDIPGNKWRKLKYTLQRAHAERATTLLTFGGAYSNHIRAVAAAGERHGFATIGVIRGEEHLPLNDSLAYAVARGMRLTYVDRSTYRRKREPDVVAALRDRFGDFLLIPEGGSNADAVRGCAELPAEITVDYDLICCACGTGGTLAGIAAGTDRAALGFAALRGDFLPGEVRGLQRAFGKVTDNWLVDTDHHFGGFARRTPGLDAFIEDFAARHDFRPDWVYVAKMLYGLYDRVGRGDLDGARVVAVVTG